MTLEEYETGLQNLTAALALGCKRDPIRATRFSRYISGFVAELQKELTELRERVGELEKNQLRRSRAPIRDLSNQITFADDDLPPVDELQALVNEQAEDEALWSVPAIGKQSIGEAYLQQELRRLHAAIEKRTIPTPSQPQEVDLKLNDGTGQLGKVEHVPQRLVTSDDEGWCGE